MVIHRQKKRCGLSGAGLRLTGHVTSAERNGQRLCLNRRAKLKSRLVNGLKQNLWQPEAMKFNIRYMLISHAFKSRITVQMRLEQVIPVFQKTAHGPAIRDNVSERVRRS
jgi:hypothetical protein